MNLRHFVGRSSGSPIVRQMPVKYADLRSIDRVVIEGSATQDGVLLEVHSPHRDTPVGTAFKDSNGLQWAARCTIKREAKLD